LSSQDEIGGNRGIRDEGEGGFRGTIALCELFALGCVRGQLRRGEGGNGLAERSASGDLVLERANLDGDDQQNYAD
jgi:hypothetical protein